MADITKQPPSFSNSHISNNNTLELFFNGKRNVYSTEFCGVRLTCKSIFYLVNNHGTRTQLVDVLDAILSPDPKRMKGIKSNPLLSGQMIQLETTADWIKTLLSFVPDVLGYFNVLAHATKNRLLDFKELLANIPAAIANVGYGMSDICNAIARTIKNWLLESASAAFKHALTNMFKASIEVVLRAMLGCMALYAVATCNTSLALGVAALSWANSEIVKIILTPVLTGQSIEHAASATVPLLGLYALHSFYNSPNKMEFKTAIKGFKEGSLMVRAAKIYMTELPVCLETATSWICALFGLDNPFLDSIIAGYPEFPALFTRSQRVLQFPSHEMTPVNAGDVVAVYEDLVAFREGLEAKHDMPMYKHVSDIMKEISTIYQTARAMRGASSNERPQPVMINMFGKPAVGKTHTQNTMLKLCAMYLNERHGVPLPEYLSDATFTFNQDDEYQSGFTGQDFMKIDEVFLKQDSAVTPNTLLPFLVATASPTAKTAVMADLPSKGRFMSFKLIMCTSNISVANYHVRSVDPVAFKRRFTDDIETVVTEAAGTWNAEGQYFRINKAAAANMNFQDIWRYRCVCPETGVIRADDLTFNQLMNRVFNYLDEYMQEYTNIVRALKDEQDTFRNRLFQDFGDRFPDQVPVPDQDDVFVDLDALPGDGLDPVPVPLDGPDVFVDAPEQPDPDDGEPRLDRGVPLEGQVLGITRPRVAISASQVMGLVSAANRKMWAWYNGPSCTIEDACDECFMRLRYMFLTHYGIPVIRPTICTTNMCCLTDQQVASVARAASWFMFDPLVFEWVKDCHDVPDAQAESFYGKFKYRWIQAELDPMRERFDYIFRSSIAGKKLPYSGFKHGVKECNCDKCVDAKKSSWFVLLLASAVLITGVMMTSTNLKKSSGGMETSKDALIGHATKYPPEVARGTLATGTRGAFTLRAQDAYAVLGREPDPNSVETHYKADIDSLIEAIMHKVHEKGAPRGPDQRANQITRKIYNSMFRIHICNDVDGETWFDLDNAFCLKGTLMVTVKHGYNKVNECKLLRLWRVGEERPVELNRTDFTILCHRNQDIMVLDVSLKKMAAGANIFKHFAKVRDFAGYEKVRATVLGCFTPSGKRRPWIKTSMVMANALDKTNQDYTTPLDFMTIRERWMYDFPGEPGDCGSLMYAQHSLVGMHIAGSSTVGVSLPLCQEFFEQWLGPRLASAIDDKGNDIRTFEPGSAAVLGDVVSQGTIPVSLAAQATKIKASPVHDELDSIGWCIKSIAPLGRFQYEDGEENVMIKAGQKMGESSPNELNEGLLHECIDAYSYDIRVSGVLKDHQRVYTRDEAIFGIEGNDRVNSIDLGTSSGVGWEYKGPTKAGLVNLTDRTVIPDFDHAITGLERAYSKGERPLVLVKTVPKDETRPKHKAETGKTRPIQCYPAHFVVLCRKFYLGFIEHMLLNKIDNECAVGCDPTGHDWDLLYHRLHRVVDEKQPSFVAGDFSRFDASFLRFIIICMFKIFLDFYGNDGEVFDVQGYDKPLNADNRIRFMLLHEIASAILINCGYVYSLKRGHPSGHTLTTWINSMFNCTMFRYGTSFLLMEAKIPYTPDSFRRYFTFIAFGDDNILGVHPMLLHVINQLSITRALKTAGLDYTDETKDNTHTGLRHLMECSFLARDFYQHPIFGMVGKLQLPILKNMLCFVRGNEDSVLSYKTNLQTALRECAYHGEEVYNEYRNTIREVNLRKANIIGEVSTPSYSETILGIQQECPSSVDPTWQFCRAMAQPVEKQNNVSNMTNTTLNQKGAADSYNQSAPTDTDRSNLTMTNEMFAQTSNVILEGQMDPISTETEQITTFRDEGINFTTHVGPSGPANPLISIGDEGREHSIKDIIERPITLTTSDWLEADGQGDTISSVSIPSDCMLSHKNMLKKMAGFAYFRADMRIKVLVNEPPFTQGKLWVWYHPASGDTTAYDPNFNTNMSIFRMTGFYGGELDLGAGGTVELTIPCVTPFGFYDLVNGRCDWGRLHITILNPLKRDPPDFSPVTVRKMVWFENVHLTYPTGISTVTPSASYKERVSNQVKKKVKSKARPALAGQTVDTDGEAKSSKGLVSKPLSAIANVATALSVVPELGFIAGPVAWVARLGSAVARSVGYCKETSQESTRSFANIPAKGFTQGHGLDAGVRLGNTQDGRTIIPPGITGTAEDEMQILNLAKRPALYKTFSWTTSRASGDMLDTWIVSPMTLQSMFTPGFILGYDTTPLSYITGGFKFWRGSLVYRFSVAKTAYHSGRIRISLFPRMYGVRDNYPSDDYDPENVFNVVWDLRESSECVFTVPYCSPYTWSTTDVMAPNQGLNLNNELMAVGSILITVFNPLAGNGVAQDVDINVWVSAGEDYALAVPTVGFTPVEPIPSDPATPSTGQLPFALANKVVLQGQVLETDHSAEIAAGLAGGGNRSPEFGSTTKALQVAQMTHGEMVTTVRESIKRFGLYYRKEQGAAPTSTVMFDAHMFGVRCSAEPFGNSIAHTNVDYFAYMFAYHAGSMRYKVIFGSDVPTGVEPVPPVGNTMTNILVRVDVFFTHYRRFAVEEADYQATQYADGQETGMLYTTMQDIGLNPIVEFEIPHLKQFPIGFNFLDHPANTGVSAFRESGVIVRVSAFNQSATSQSVALPRFSVYRAAGDDFSYMWPTGTPPITHTVFALRTDQKAPTGNFWPNA